jgi:hypothetical protein
MRAPLPLFLRVCATGLHASGFVPPAYVPPACVPPAYVPRPPFSYGYAIPAYVPLVFVPPSYAPLVFVPTAYVPPTYVPPACGPPAHGPAAPCSYWCFVGFLRFFPCPTGDRKIALRYGLSCPRPLCGHSQAFHLPPGGRKMVLGYGLLCPPPANPFGGSSAALPLPSRGQEDSFALWPAVPPPAPLVFVPPAYVPPTYVPRYPFSYGYFVGFLS